MKFILSAIAVLLLFIGCINGVCEGKIQFASGLTICYEGGSRFSEDDIDIVVNEIEYQTNLIYPEVKDISNLYRDKNVYIKIVPHKLAMDCISIDSEVNLFGCKNTAIGATVGGNQVYLYDHIVSQCILATAFVHEMLHVLDAVYEFPNPTGDDHGALRLFMNTATEPSLVKLINESVRKNLKACDDLYIK